MSTLIEEFRPYAHVLDKGHIYVEQQVGSDLSIVNAARVSFGKRKDELDDSDIGLIRYLIKHRHGTPFEHNSITFVAKAPLFVFREWHRHRIASINEQSARYVLLPNEFYVPDRDQIREQKGKPGSYEYETVESDAWAHDVRTSLEEVMQQSYDLYQTLVESGIAKEVARIVQPVAMYSEMWWTVNLRAAMNFLSLRNADNAQWEIRQYAIQMESMLEQYFPHAMEAFVDNGRIAP